MSERWETVPVRREVRKALMDTAEWVLEDKPVPPAPIYWALMAAARQFREDVLAAEGRDSVSKQEKSKSQQELEQLKFNQIYAALCANTLTHETAEFLATLEGRVTALEKALDDRGIPRGNA